MLLGGRTRLVLGVTAVALLAPAAGAHACGPDAYYTPEELESGLYDTTPPPWDSGAPHTHDAGPTSATPQGAEPAAPPPTADPPADGGGAPATDGSEPAATTAPAVDPGAQEQEASGRPEATRTSGQSKPPVAEPVAAPHQHARPTAAQGGADTIPQTGAATDAVKHQGGAVSAAERSQPKPRPGPRTSQDEKSATRAGRQAPAAIRVSAPVSQRPSRTPARPATAPSPGTPLIAAILFAFAVATAAGLAVVMRRPGGPRGSRSEPLPPAPWTDGEIEAELQELIAEEHAGRVLAQRRTPH